ncbi:hypothetical protein [Auritidibacter sp. NML100628]|uniref:hypothetical protein n=1 Tax=Auritidibacter sp. NML100628 TaxID=2170742 RepID=UPI00351527E8
MSGSPSLPCTEIIREACGKLRSSKSTAIIAGGGVKRSGQTAREELKILAETLDAPVVCTPRGNSVFPGSHELSFGSWIEDSYITEYLNEVETLIAVGTSLSEVSSNYFSMNPLARLFR